MVENRYLLVLAYYSPRGPNESGKFCYVDSSISYQNTYDVLEKY